MPKVETLRKYEVSRTALAWLGGAALLVCHGLAQEVEPQAPEGGKTAALPAEDGSRARKAGALPDAATQDCAAAERDAKYAKRCEKARRELETTLGRFAAAFEVGQMELARRDYAGALRDLSKITFGPHLEEASRLIEQARLGSGQITPEQVGVEALAKARGAYALGDLDQAEKQLGRVAVSGLREQADRLLTDIHVYRQSMKDADELASAGDHKAAAAKYGFAAIVQPKGPGDPGQRQKEEQGLAEAAAVEAEPPPAPAAPAPQPAAPAPVRAKGRTAKMPAPAGSEDKAANASLAQAITDLYASRFASADRGLRRYLQGGGGRHAGAAHFFLGDSLYTQALLADPRDGRAAGRMRQEARAEFAAARQLHYVPVAADVSPRILSQWSRAGEKP